jgi:hypothetical protein
MKEPSTPGENAVFLEFTRRDVKPVEEAKVIDQIAESCNMSYQRTRKAAQELFKKGYLYGENEKSMKMCEPEKYCATCCSTIAR